MRRFPLFLSLLLLGARATRLAALGLCYAAFAVGDLRSAVADEPGEMISCHRQSQSSLTCSTHQYLRMVDEKKRHFLILGLIIFLLKCIAAQNQNVTGERKDRGYYGLWRSIGGNNGMSVQRGLEKTVLL